jgi:TRAP-type C4-dicarboxylate transport system substrate-binding protein
MISTHLWDRLSSQEQEWLQAAANASAIHQRMLWEQAEVEALNAVEAAGVTIIRPDKIPFAESTASLLEAYKSDPTAYDYIKRIQAMSVQTSESTQGETP